METKGKIKEFIDSIKIGDNIRMEFIYYDIKGNVIRHDDYVINIIERVDQSTLSNPYDYFETRIVLSSIPKFIGSRYKFSPHLFFDKDIQGRKEILTIL